MVAAGDTSSLVLVHGAGSGPWVFDGWAADLPGISVHAIDLQDGVDVTRASMADYRERVVAAVEEVGRPAAVCGWSMGGLVALMSAQEVRLSALVLLEPSPPGEVQGFEPDALLDDGTFDPEAVYGRFPADIASRPESSLARAERKRGISVPAVECPTLVISGREFRRERGDPVAALYGAQHIHFPELSHWDLVLRPEVRQAVAPFVATH